MNLPSTPSAAQINAALRYIGVTVGALVSGAAVIGIVDQSQAAQIVASLQAVVQDLTQTAGDISKLVLLIAPVVTFWLAKLGYNSASPRSQIASVQAMPEAQVTVSNPELAKGILGVKIGAVQTSKGK